MKKVTRIGMTLVEIMVGISILVTFLLPVMGLFSMNNRSNEFSESWVVAMDMANNIMERLISEDVPFLAIDEQGYGGGTATLSGRTQAEFLDSRGSLNFASFDLKSVLGGNGGTYKTDADGDRIISRRGTDYKILFYAGVYKENGATNPDTSLSPGGGSRTIRLKRNANPGGELTFSYYPNPWFDAQNDCALDFSASLSGLAADSTGCRVTNVRPINPYKQLSGASAGKHYSNNASDPMGPNYRFGFPSPGTTAFTDGHSAPNNRARENAADEILDEILLDRPYQPRYDDKPTHHRHDADGDGQDDGALMKIVLGIKWSPRGLGGAGAAREDQEFWLVSFKANLARDK
ncbi:MAG: hypothetical protein H3C47_06750 [Candidatus Cloacimonetes bacterium]|nr:hypothetical protein [Candidatus Cloacimonadota bacterium]